MRVPRLTTGLACLLIVGALAPVAASAHGDELDGPPPPIVLGSHRVDGKRATLIAHSDLTTSLRRRTTLRAAGRVALADAGSAGLPQTWCGEARGSDDTADATFPGLPTIKLIYAYPSDRANRFAAFAPVLQGNVAELGRFVAQQAAGAKTIRFDLGTSCGPDYADIRLVALPRATASYMDGSGSPSLAKLSADLAPVLQDESPGAARNYMVYADGLRGAGGVLGTAEAYLGPAAEVPGPENPHNDGGLFGVIWGSASFTPSPSGGTVEPDGMLHELMHTLGAVQDSAPHSSQAGHCFDEWDVLCYDDGGPTSGLTFPCAHLPFAIDEALDCGQDDYFNPAPALGSYLATHWNTANSAFIGTCIELAVSCGDAAPTPGTPPPSTPPPTTPAPPPSDTGQPATSTPTSRAASVGGRTGWLRRVRGGGPFGPLIGLARIESRFVPDKLVVTVPALRVRLPRGHYRLWTCVRAPASAGSDVVPTPDCHHRTVRLRRPRSVLTPRLVVSLPADTSRAAVTGQVRLDRLIGGRIATYATTGDTRHPLTLSGRAR